MSDNLPTDEDRLIYKLHVHKNMITWVIERLAEAGIQAKRTRGNNPHGDIVLLDPVDVPRVQQIIRDIQAEANKNR